MIPATIRKTSSAQGCVTSAVPGTGWGNVFTKVKMDYGSDAALCSYFAKNIKRIEGWFNVISPKGKSLKEMKRDLSALAGKNWEGVYERIL